MKRTVLALMLVLLGTVAAAQPKLDGAPAPSHHNLTFSSQHGETFTVFIDGDQQNRMPQSRVMVNNVSSQTHEVVIVTKRPVEKAAVLSLRPGEPNVVVNINYDQRLEKLYLYTAAHNRAETAEALDQPQRRRLERPTRAPMGVQHEAPLARPAHKPAPVNDDELNSMAARMQAQSFDSDRLALGKVLVTSSSLTAAQIAYLARTLDYSQSQVEFLKYAYAYCSDKNNYSTTVDILTYRADRQKVLDYIATQR